MRNSRKHILIITAFCAACAAGAASAQYVGPSGMRTTTVAEVLKNARDDQQVMLQGVLRKKVGHEKYEFADGTGAIRVEIDSKDFPLEAIDEKTRIEIVGEVERDFMTTPEIDADAVRRIATP